jgi:hypothetical protein
MNKIPSPESLAALEKSLLTISDMLRCTTAVAYESGEARAGDERDLPFAVVHMLGAMRAELDLSLRHVGAC